MDENPYKAPPSNYPFWFSLGWYTFYASPLIHVRGNRFADHLLEQFASE
jgi:hypothetical protein